MTLPHRPLTNIDLLKLGKIMKIPHFRGVYMRDTLPASGPLQRESGIVNLDENAGPGTHWVAYKKTGRKVMYFDSFGDLQPPNELMSYFNVGSVNYNYERYQEFDTIVCGHLCLKFLCGQLNRRDNYVLYKRG